MNFGKIIKGIVRASDDYGYGGINAQRKILQDINDIENGVKEYIIKNPNTKKYMINSDEVPEPITRDSFKQIAREAGDGSFGNQGSGNKAADMIGTDLSFGDVFGIRNPKVSQAIDELISSHNTRLPKLDDVYKKLYKMFQDDKLDMNDVDSIYRNALYNNGNVNRDEVIQAMKSKILRDRQ